jgi:[ribosomal protein S5]-alanine N-acetyltransferase
MLGMASFPPDRSDIRRWFADPARERQAGRAHRFAIEIEGRMIGVIDIDGGRLGYLVGPF